MSLCKSSVLAGRLCDSVSLALSRMPSSATCEHTGMLGAGPALGAQDPGGRGPPLTKARASRRTASSVAGRERTEGRKINFDSDKEEEKNHFYKEEGLAHQFFFLLLFF